MTQADLDIEAAALQLLEQPRRQVNGLTRRLVLILSRKHSRTPGAVQQRITKRKEELEDLYARKT